MSCNGNRSAFFAAVSGGNSAAAQAFGGPDAAQAALDQLYDAASNGPKPPTDARLDEAQTRVLFLQMHQRGIRSPTHSTTRLPKKDSQYGYALVQRTLAALERGEPLPPQARDLLLAQQRQRLISNLRSGSDGCVRCGQFASSSRGIPYPTTNTSRIGEGA